MEPTSTGKNEKQEPSPELEGEVIQVTNNQGLINTGQFKYANLGAGSQHNTEQLNVSGDNYQGNTFHIYNQIANINPSIPALPELVRRYLEALRKQFEIYDDVENIVPLRMQPGKLQPAKPVPKALRRDLEKLKVRLQPRYSPQPTRSLMSLRPDPGQPEVAIEDFLREKIRVALLGAPGTGKSTTLRQLVKVYGQPWLAKAIPDEQSFAIPIFAALNQWHNPSTGLEEFLQAQLVQLNVPELAKMLPQLLRRGQVILLLDGLNELPQLERNEQTQLVDDPRVKALARLAEQTEWSKVACVLSCRVNEFVGGLEWHDLHVLPLTKTQVEAFAQAYYAGDPQAENLVKNLLNGLYESKNKHKLKLQGLAAQPFYLRKLLTFYYFQQELPENAAQLIKYSVEEAIEREVAAGRMAANEEEDLVAWLGYLAFGMTESGKVNLDRTEALSQILADYQKVVLESEANSQEIPVIEQIVVDRLFELAGQTGLLLTTENGLQFSHQLIQEYFCAQFLELVGLEEGLLKRLRGSGFREIWSIWQGLTETNDLVEKLIAYLSHPHGKIRSNAVEALGAIGDSRAVEPLAELLYDENMFISYQASQTLGQIGSAAVEKLVEMLEIKVKDEANFVHYRVISALEQIGDPRAIEPLITLIKSRDRFIRYSVAGALGRTGAEAVIKPLISLLQDNISFVRYNAVQALGEIGSSQAVEPLLSTLEEEETKSVQRKLVQALGTIGDSRALPILEQLAKIDNEVSEVATEAISKITEKLKT